MFRRVWKTTMNYETINVEGIETGKWISNELKTNWVRRKNLKKKQNTRNILSIPQTPQLVFFSMIALKAISKNKRNWFEPISWFLQHPLRHSYRIVIDDSQMERKECVFLLMSSNQTQRCFLFLKPDLFSSISQIENWMSTPWLNRKSKTNKLTRNRPKPSQLLFTEP